MFGAMYIGLSGMTAYSNGLRQVSNNITNLNSLGFRASEVSFNYLYQGQDGGLTNDGLGRGDGVQLGEQRLDFSQGELRQTQNELDLAIDGNGFLVLEKDGEFFYARTGSFDVDEDGFIVLSGSDYRLTLINEDGVPEALTVNSYQTNLPEPTTRIEFTGIFSNSNSDGFPISDVEVFNELGESDNWSFRFDQTEDFANAREWEMTVTNSEGVEIANEIIKFNVSTIDPSSTSFTIQDEELGISVTVEFPVGEVQGLDVGLRSTINVKEVDGYGPGEIVNISVNETGILQIQYSNEETQDLGGVALADFREIQLLEQRNAGLFSYKRRTGVDYYSSESNKVGRVLSRRVEASNVNLSNEFGQLILVQRGYQASSQVVSISNDMIQQLFGIRGQG